MHSPETLAFSIKNPFSRKEYKPDIISIWHIDPCKGPGGDDSCGWFKRAHHGDPELLKRIEKRFEFDWDRTYTSDDDGKTYERGYFTPGGDPVLSPSAIVLNLFFLAAREYFGCGGNWKKAKNFMQRNLFEILHFAENPTDSLRDGIVQSWGRDNRKNARADRIHGMAATIYGWILRAEQKWWQHPKYHFWHWQIQVHPIAQFKRWAFSRCCKCGGRFRFGESPTTNDWNGKGPRWFRSEPHIYHSSHCGADRSDQPVEAAS